MKKLISLVAALMLLPAQALAEARIPVYRVDEALLFFNKATGEITGFAGEPGWLTIPAYIGGNKVVSIGRGAFADCQSLRKVVIEEGLTTIADRAFRGCRGLFEVRLPASASSIGDEAFDGCEALKTVTFAGPVEYVSASAFNGAPWLDSGDAEFLTAGETLLIKYNGSAKDVIIPAGVKRIAASAFAGNAAVERVSLPEGLVEIGDNAFVNCENLTNIDFPKSLAHVGVGAFDGTAWLRRQSDEFVVANDMLVAYNGSGKTVSVPDGITSVCCGAFMSNDNIAAVYLPSSLVSIEEGAFSDCSSLAAVIVPDTVQFIDDYAFAGSGVTLYGSAGSYAENFAQRNGCAFSQPVSVDVDGHGVYFDVPPIIIDGSTYVPMRAVLEEMGLSVLWNSAAREAAVTDGKITVTAALGSTGVSVDGERRTVSAPPVMLGGRVMLPVRAFAEIFGFNVGWDNRRRAVTIDSQR